MAITITFYNFNKKPNSTAVPSSGGTDFSCTLIENTDIISPNVRLNLNSVQNFSPIGKNYARIETFGRYYFVTDWIYEMGTWVAVLAVDVLATAKTAIGSSTQYVIRSSAQYDGTVVDTAYPTRTATDCIMVRAETGETYGTPKTIFGDVPYPCYIVGIISGLDPVSFLPSEFSTKFLFDGSVVYYALRLPQISQLYEMLLSDVNMYAVPSTEISQALQKQLLNPLQYIHSIKMMPCFPPTLTNTVAGIDLGFDTFYIPHQAEMGKWSVMYNTDIEGYAPGIGQTKGYLASYRCNVHVPVHPEYENRGHYVIGQPFSRYVLRVEPFGAIELASGNILASNISLHHDPQDPGADYYYIDVKLDTIIDFSTGDCRLRVWSMGDGGEVDFYTGVENVSVPVPVHQTVQDAMTFNRSMREIKANAISAPFDAVKSLLVGSGTSQTVNAGQTATSGTLMENRNTTIGLQGRSAVGTVVGAIEQGKALVDSATVSNQVQVSGTGSTGSKMSFCKDLCSPVVQCFFSPFVEELNSDIGRPLMKAKQISTIPGYILCDHGHIISGLTASENQTIEAFLNGGFYYE